MDNLVLKFNKLRRKLDMGAASSDQSLSQQPALSNNVRCANEERKKRFPRLINLRKKLSRGRTAFRTQDHAKVLKELIQNWSTQEISDLVDEYEALIALKDSITQTNLTRPFVSSLKQDMLDLLENKYCSDVTLVFNGIHFPANKAILSSRCSYFRDLFAETYNMSPKYPINIPADGISTEMFSTLLQYLYTGDFLNETSGLESLELLMQLGDEFGTPNVLEQDLKDLLHTAEQADTVLVFQGHNYQDLPADSSVTETCFEVPCHKAILCARSPYFRSLFLKQDHNFPISQDCGCLRLLLDEHVFPRQYARVVLQCMYTDSFDLSSVVKWSSDDRKGCGQETHKLLTTAEIAMEVYEVAKFIDFDMLAQGCEDILLEELSPSSLLTTLEWSSKPHGSDWVAKQAENYLLEDFLIIARSEVFTKLPKKYLMQVIKSDFLQACEQDILLWVMRWGEAQVARKMIAKQDPILDGKRSVKLKDIDNKALKKELSCLKEHVRVQHIIPRQSEVLESALSRGLIKRGMPLDIGEGSFYPRCPWMRRRNDKDFVRPRLFLPYYQEAKSILQERQDAELDMVQQRMLHMGKSIPDTLYMVSDSKRKHHSALAKPAGSLAGDTLGFPGQRQGARSDKVPGAYCRRRRSNSLPQVEGVSNRSRLLPEFGLPDIAAEVLIYDGDDDDVTPDDVITHESTGSPGPIPDVAASLSSSPAHAYGEATADMAQLDQILGYLGRGSSPSS